MKDDMETGLVDTRSSSSYLYAAGASKQVLLGKGIHGLLLWFKENIRNSKR